MRRLTLAVVMLFASLLTRHVQLVCADERDDFFEAKIRPVLVETCFRCHGDAKTSGALRIDSREMLLKGGDSGAAIVPGKPDESLLIQGDSAAARCLSDASGERHGFASRSGRGLCHMDQSGRGLAREVRQVQSRKALAV